MCDVRASLQSLRSAVQEREPTRIGPVRALRASADEHSAELDWGFESPDASPAGTEAICCGRSDCLRRDRGSRPVRTDVESRRSTKKPLQHFNTRILDPSEMTAGEIADLARRQQLGE
jgi:hypothetical protein